MLSSRSPASRNVPQILFLRLFVPPRWVVSSSNFAKTPVSVSCVRLAEIFAFWKEWEVSRWWPDWAAFTFSAGQGRKTGWTAFCRVMTNTQIHTLYPKSWWDEMQTTHVTDQRLNLIFKYYRFKPWKFSNVLLSLSLIVKRNSLVLPYHKTGNLNIKNNFLTFC